MKEFYLRRLAYHPTSVIVIKRISSFLIMNLMQVYYKQLDDR